MSRRSADHGQSSAGSATWLALALLAIANQMVVAHPLAVTSADVHIVENRLMIAVDVTPHDLEHAGLGANDQAAVGACAERLVDGIVALDERGVPLEIAPGDIGERAWMLDENVRYVTLQLSPLTVPSAPKRQTHLWVFQRGDQTPTGMARLTGPGSASVLDVQAMRSSANTSGHAVLPSDRFRTGRIELRLSQQRVEVHALLPAPLLSSWQLLPRVNRDSPTSAEMDRQATALNAWLRAHVRLRVNGAATAIRASEPRWLGPGDSLHCDGPSASLPARCYGSLRVHLTLIADVERLPSNVELICSAFSAGVLGLDGCVVQEGQVLLEGSLTQYGPRMVWQRSDAETVVRIGQRKVSSKAWEAARPAARRGGFFRSPR